MCASAAPAEPALRDAARRSTRDALVGQTWTAVLAWSCAEPDTSAAKAAAAAAIVPAAEAHAEQVLQAAARRAARSTRWARSTCSERQDNELLATQCRLEGGIDGRSIDLPSSLPASSSWWRSFSEPLVASKFGAARRVEAERELRWARCDHARPGPPRREGGLST